MSAERRRLVGMAGALAALSGSSRVLLQQAPHWLRWGWLAVMAALLVWVIALMLRLKQKEGCYPVVRAGSQDAPGS